MGVIQQDKGGPPIRRAIGESVGGTIGMLVGAAIGFQAVLWATNYGVLAALRAGVLSVVALVALMIGCSILGGMIRR